MSSETLSSSEKPTARATLRTWPLLVFASSLALAYGYLIFSSNLTIDEEVAGGLDRVTYALRWVSQGRWSMAALTLALPNSVVPVVSAGLGVTLSAVAWWLLCRKYLSMSSWEAAFAASLAGTIPVLAFLFSFSTVAYGVGVGNLLLVVYMRGLNARSWRDRGLGVLAAAAALGIYDTFLAAFVALSLLFIYRRPRLSSIGLGLGIPALALALSRAIGLLVSWAVHAPQGSYLSSHIDVGGLFTEPGARVFMAIKNVIKVIFLTSERFGLHSPWLAVVLAVLSTIALISALRLQGKVRAKTIRVGALACLAFIPFGAEAISPGPVPLRSMIYLPIIVLVLTSIALRLIRSLLSPRKAVVSGLIAALVVLSVLGNATITNRLFAAAGRTYALDQDLAFAIGQQKDRLLSGDNRPSLPLVMSGQHSWPNSLLTPTRETLGASFFGYGGSTYRAVGFLLSQRVMVRAATPEEASSSWPLLSVMPVYPQPGWIAINKGVLLLKFGDRVPANQ